MLRPDSTRATSFACIVSGFMEFRAGFGTEHIRHSQPLTCPAFVCAKAATGTMIHSGQSAVTLIHCKWSAHDPNEKACHQSHKQDPWCIGPSVALAGAITTRQVEA